MTVLYGTLSAPYNTWRIPAPCWRSDTVLIQIIIDKKDINLATAPCWCSDPKDIDRILATFKLR
jgi:hypothetical protein